MTEPINIVSRRSVGRDGINKLAAITPALRHLDTKPVTPNGYSELELSLYASALVQAHLATTTEHRVIDDDALIVILDSLIAAYLAHSKEFV